MVLSQPDGLLCSQLRPLAGAVLAALACLACSVPADAFQNPITKLKPLHRETPLVAGGKAEAVVLVPDTPAGKRAGETVAARVKEVSGAALPVVTDPARADLAQTNVVALGNLLDNPLIERLYWNRYAFADKLYPGAGRFTLRSACNPYPWAAGRNAFLVEASDDEGMLAGARALAERITGGQDVALPWTLLYSGYTPPKPADREKARAALKPGAGFREFHTAVLGYLKIPNPILIDQAKLTLESLCEVYEKDPKHHLTWPDETTSEWIAPMWDAVEECGEFSDEERLRTTNLLLTQLRSHPQHIYEFRDLEKATSITWNHITFPLMGLYFSSRYFRAYYPEVDRDQMETFRRKIEACFAGQEKCWKPREDSAGYITITPRHVMTWCLAENRRTWFEKGFPRAFAEHVMALGDPMGYTAGHGDHPLARAPSDEMGALGLPFYLTRDPRLLWRLNQLWGGEWSNPYWRDVKPAPPDDLLGLHVDPMHPEYYEWSNNIGVYGTPAVPHNVPFERSFDKLVMRTAWDRDAQYLLLDGFGRGYHLHYDTNMIVKYTNAGEVLLMDSDYLIRNTTEHNGLSVVRDGRSETLIPTLASLDAKASLPGCLMSRTSVLDYNGVDWHRTLLMVRGGPVAVFDEAVAKEPADYTFWCVWKTLDEGKEEIAGPGLYRVLRPGNERLADPGFAPVKSADARGGEAAEFVLKSAEIAFSVKLAPGRHTLKLRGYGTGGGNDSLWVYVDDRAEPAGFHFPKNAFGEAMGTWDLAAPAPGIEVSRGGGHRFRIALREAPGLVLDTIQLLDAAGKVVFDRRAIDLAAPDGKRVHTPDQRFYVANAGGPALLLSPRVNANNEAVQRLRQVANVRLAAGESHTYQNLLASVFDSTEPPRMRRLGERAFRTRVAGETYVFAAGDPERAESFGPLKVAARAFALGRGKLWLLDAREATLNGKALHRSETPESKEVAVAPGVVDALVAATAGPAAGAGRAPKADPGRARPAWSFRPDVPVYREGPEFVETADVDGDGAHEVLYGAGNTLYVLGEGGRLLWKHAAKDRVRSCAVADLGGARTVLLGGNDERVTLLDAAGKEIRSWHCDVQIISGQGHGRYPEVTALAAADINGDGRVEILAGTRNCWVIAYTPEGEELWKDSAQYHGVRRILVEDVDGDGKPEVLSANRYGSIRIYDAAGKLKHGTSSELGDVSMCLGRTLANKPPMVVNGSSTGVLKARLIVRDAQEFTFSNNGFGVNEVACADVNGDGLDEILVASETGYVYCLDGTGKEVWRSLLGSVVRDVAAADLDGDGKVEVVCAGEDGSLHLLSGAGVLLGTHTGPTPLVFTAACRTGKATLALGAARDGTLTAVNLAGTR